MTFTEEEKDYIALAFELLRIHLKEHRDQIRIYLAYLEDMGEISQVGKLYEDNIELFNKRDRMRKYIDKQIDTVNRLRNKIIYEIQ